MFLKDFLFDKRWSYFQAKNSDMIGTNIGLCL